MSSVGAKQPRTLKWPVRTFTIKIIASQLGYAEALSDKPGHAGTALGKLSLLVYYR